MTDWDQFWKCYPRHDAKQDALKAWTKLHPSPELVTEMLAALTWQVTRYEWIKDDGQFVPLPATWIRGRRWEDEPPKSLDRTRSTNGILLECPHTPKCLARWACGQRQLQEREAS